MHDGRIPNWRTTLKAMIATVGILLATNLWRPAVQAAGADDMPVGMSFSEGFDDGLLRDRGWYDGDKFNQYLLTPYFGPGLLPHEQTLWIDELAVSTQRLGPLANDSRAAAPAGALRDARPQRQAPAARCCRSGEEPHVRLPSETGRMRCCRSTAIWKS